MPQSSVKTVYLTFDDGPQRGVTDWVLALLSDFNAKATFFVVGENVTRFPKLFRRLTDEGHAVGNHTQNHMKGWSVSNSEYYENIARCERLLNQPVNSKLFRPPYGRITLSQLATIRKDYKVVMWEVLANDFNSRIAPERCLDNCIRHTKDTSIVVFHDSLKAENRLKSILPKYLDFLRTSGYQMSPIIFGS